MESIVARAFKSSSFISELAFKPANSHPLAVVDDSLFPSPSLPADDFSVDEFFDLQGLSKEEEEEDKSSSSSSSSLSSQDQIDEGSSFSEGFPSTGVSGFLPAADDLAIPVDAMKELELWSHLMEDTLSDDVFACPTRHVYVKTGPIVDKRARFDNENKPVVLEATRFTPPIPMKPRSKRIKTASGAWSVCSILKPDYSSSSSCGSPEPGLVFEKSVHDAPGKSKKPGVKKLKRKQAELESGGSLTGPVQQRKCTHCQIQKTPQWRTGPLGPKTLCNACGVRFKSGRLFPEYRPACSPTFSSEVHSNSHRKVLEMRKKKIDDEPTPTPTILSC